MNKVFTPPIIVPVVLVAVVLAYGFSWRLAASSGSWAESISNMTWSSTGAPT